MKVTTYIIIIVILAIVAIGTIFSLSSCSKFVYDFNNNCYYEAKTKDDKKRIIKQIGGENSNSFNDGEHVFVLNGIIVPTGTPNAEKYIIIRRIIE